MKEDQIPQMPEECLEAFLTISRIGQAKGYTFDSWKDEAPERHIGKALGHLGKWLVVYDEEFADPAAEGEEDHLLHAMWRICAAVSQVINLRRAF